jgi:SAM-dependent methyltransferase
MKICLGCERRFDRPDWTCPSCGWTAPRAAGIPCLGSSAPNSQVGYDPEFFGQLARIEAGHFWFRSRNRLLTWAIRRFFPKARNFLEVGCGTGFVLLGLSRAFPSLSLTGSEVLCEGLAVASQRVPQAAFLQMDARRIPFADEFDVAGAFDVLEHIEDDEQVLREIYRSVRPGGGALFTVPQHPGLWSQVDARSGHRRRYRRDELQRKVARAGFRLVHTTSFMTALLPLMWLARRGKRRELQDPLAEFRIGSFLNACLGGPLFLESIWLRLGLRLPVGGSRLVVARKDAP